MKTSVILPSLNPDEKLEQVVCGLNAVGFDDIIIINDGSDSLHLAPFEQLAKNPTCTILVHKENKGKGRALKTGMKYVLDNRKGNGVVTVDGDNQHKADDVLACCKAMIADDKIILGARSFNQSNIPAKSRIGNKITAFVFRFACGIKITDTQTGLRAIPYKYLAELEQVHGERFEYETNMLLEMKKANMEYAENQIETVYIQDNQTSHFNPLKDSLRIYKVIFSFILSSLSCFLIDIGIFTLLNLLLADVMEEKGRLLLATICARVISSIVNFIVNRQAVFKPKAGMKTHIIHYYILCVIQLLASYMLLYGLTLLCGANEILQSVLKAGVDTALFFISFQIQREWVFK